MWRYVTAISSKRVSWFSILLVTAGFLSIPKPAEAAQLRGATIAPNWTLGSPQPVFIRGCSDADAFGLSCLTTFGIGPVSDDLRINLLGRPVGTEASLAENARINVFGLLETGNETLGDWWNLWIPNARWVGLGANAGIGYLLSDPGDVRVGDAIAYVNINNAAHILWASNNSDEASATLPADFLTLFNSLVPNPVNVNTNMDGSYDQTMVPLPTNGGMDCTTDPLCTPTSDFLPVPSSVPEPGSFLLAAIGLIGLARYRRQTA